MKEQKNQSDRDYLNRVYGFLIGLIFMIDSVLIIANVNSVEAFLITICFGIIITLLLNIKFGDVK